MTKEQVTYMPRPHDNELMRVPLITNDELKFMLNAVGGLTKTQVDSVWELMVRIRGSYERDRSPFADSDGASPDLSTDMFVRLKEEARQMKEGVLVKKKSETGLEAMREVRDRVDAEYRIATAQMEKFTHLEELAGRRKHAIIFKRGALSTALAGLRSAIMALEEEGDSEE